MKRRRKIILALILALGGAVLIARMGSRPSAPKDAAETCFVTGSGELRVCHLAQDEGVYYRPSSVSVAYNLQIIQRGAQQYATVLHSEAEDSSHYREVAGHVRPGDSIKAGTLDTNDNPAAVYSAPPNLAFKIWGTLSNPHSPLYYATYPETTQALSGEGGGGNPMVIAGRRDKSDPYFYMYFVGTSSDNGQFQDWRNVLLEARTRDFERFDVLQLDHNGEPIWAPFNGVATIPAIIVSQAGRPIVSNRAVNRSSNGSLPVFGLIGSIVLLNNRYLYFYTDLDPANQNMYRLYVREADDLSHQGTWSEPRVIMDTPPEILIRVAKAKDMDRWAVFYNCARATPGRDLISDICVQYTRSLDLDGPDGIAGLQLFDGPSYTGKSKYFLGLVGERRERPGEKLLKIQHFYMTNPVGDLAVPSISAQRAGMLTWTDMPSNWNIFGAPAYWGQWSVTRAGPEAANQQHP